LLGLSQAATTASASSIHPSPPLVQASLGTASSTPASRAFLRTSSISASVSEVNLLIATTTGTPWSSTFSICFIIFSQPFSRAGIFSFSINFLSSGTPGRAVKAPPCILRALTVATTTAQSSFNPLWRHLTFISFSQPQSAPKPLSVTT